MRLSRYFLPLLKETPSDATIVSHQYMLRAGMIRQNAAGIYTWLPLGHKVLKKIEQIVREVDDTIAFRAVRATRGKALRAEPVAALYEQGRVVHLSEKAALLSTLEDQMCAFGPHAFTGDTRSPDRVDALVWAITDLLLTRRSEPKVRSL